MGCWEAATEAATVTPDASSARPSAAAHAAPAEPTRDFVPVVTDRVPVVTDPPAPATRPRAKQRTVHGAPPPAHDGGWSLWADLDG